ncbi:hypothetical protein D3C74_400450 [compost metagenome]
MYIGCIKVCYPALWRGEDDRCSFVLRLTHHIPHNLFKLRLRCIVLGISIVNPELQNKIISRLDILQNRLHLTIVAESSRKLTT